MPPKMRALICRDAATRALCRLDLYIHSSIMAGFVVRCTLTKKNRLIRLSRTNANTIQRKWLRVDFLVLDSKDSTVGAQVPCRREESWTRLAVEGRFYKMVNYQVGNPTGIEFVSARGKKTHCCQQPTTNSWHLKKKPSPVRPIALCQIAT